LPSSCRGQIRPLAAGQRLAFDPRPFKIGAVSGGQFPRRWSAASISEFAGLSAIGNFKGAF
jgi:hypothetical protein